MTKRPIVAVAFLIGGCAARVDEGATPSAEERLASIQEAAKAAHSAALRELCDEELRFEHFIDAGGGVRLHVIERFSGRAALRFPRRALLMLPPTLATNAWYDADVPGDPSYNASTRRRAAGISASP